MDGDLSEDGQGLMLYPEDTDLPAYLEIMSAERVGMLPWKFLEVNAPAGTAYEADVTEDGSDLHWFERRAAYSDDVGQTYYAVDGPERAVVAVATYPAGDATWRAQFDAVMRTLRFADPAPIRVDWAEATKDLLVVDKGGEYVTVMADEPVSEVALLALELTDFDEDGNVAFDTAVLFERGELRPEAHWVLKLAFPGDVPTYGIRLVDSRGNRRQFAIGVSGRDGALALEEF